MVEDAAIASARAQGAVVPGQRSDSRGVAPECPDLLDPVNVPDLHLSACSAHAEVLAIRSPGDAGDVVISLAELSEHLDGSI